MLIPVHSFVDIVAERHIVKEAITHVDVHGNNIMIFVTGTQSPQCYTVEDEDKRTRFLRVLGVYE